MTLRNTGSAGGEDGSWDRQQALAEDLDQTFGCGLGRPGGL